MVTVVRGAREWAIRYFPGMEKPALKGMQRYSVPSVENTDRSPESRTAALVYLPTGFPGERALSSVLLDRKEATMTTTTGAEGL